MAIDQLWKNKVRINSKEIRLSEQVGSSGVIVNLG